MCLLQNEAPINGDKVGMEGGSLIVQKKFQMMVQAEREATPFTAQFGREMW